MMMMGDHTHGLEKYVEFLIVNILGLNSIINQMQLRRDDVDGFKTISLPIVTTCYWQRKVSFVIIVLTAMVTSFQILQQNL